jgi:hypothetical protein
VRGVTPEQIVAPYLLPKDHIYAESIEKIFEKSNGDLTLSNISQLGFTILRKLGLHVIVAKHPNVRGLVFKFFMYGDFPGHDYEHWIKRIKGAELIRKAVKDHDYSKFFKVPHKWIVQTHSKQVINGKTCPCYVLVAENVRTVSWEKNQNIWRNLTNEKELKALHHLMKTYGLRDCARIANVPRCKDGKIAFVDTESVHTWPVNYHPLLEFLSGKNKKNWRAIVTKCGDKLAAY